MSFTDNPSKPFQAKLTHGRRTEYLGMFATAEEAALAVARFLGPEGVAAALAPPEPAPVPQPTMTAAEAHAAAAAEGLVLLRADNAAGFKFVYPKSGNNPFKAHPYHCGRQHDLGSFATAEEAALAVARFLGPAGVAAALTPPAPEPAPMTATEAHAAAAEEGLSLLRAENATVFKGVSRDKNPSKPFKAHLYHGGRQKHLGYFATAEEAAVAVTRFLGPEGVAAALAPPAPEPALMSAAEARAAAAAEGY